MFIQKLENEFIENFGIISLEQKSILYKSGIKALSLIANSNAPYHDLYHTILVTDVAQEILKGLNFEKNNINPNIWLHFILAAIHHDIGYVKGSLKNDTFENYIVDDYNNSIKISNNLNDSYLAPYHVSRSKIYVKEVFKNDFIIDKDFICDLIETTRFPIPDIEEYQNTQDLASLLRAADLIGQLADIDYHKKMKCLFIEFEESGVNNETGYKSIDDMREKYPDFFWKSVNPYIKEAIKYLNYTKDGKKWIENLYSNVALSEITIEPFNYSHKNISNLAKTEIELPLTNIFHIKRTSF
ncbi:MAG: hypothetical protein JXR51_04690 [Bacteroidales bacterium]|nr:hypothetical protein [Bacteroidales bacterium]MBN2756455.1 hypothetical protein [Bacteroidales bacterium]